MQMAVKHIAGLHECLAPFVLRSGRGDVSAKTIGCQGRANKTREIDFSTTWSSGTSDRGQLADEAVDGTGTYHDHNAH
jgi:hypothetical protein